jgi:predicted PurR-regulated permease PerM
MKESMIMEDNNNKPMNASEFADTMIGLGLAAALVILCFQVFTPFIGIMMWSVILAVTLYPVHQVLARKMGERQGRSSTVIVVTGLLILGAPLVILGTSLANHLSDGYQAFQNDTVHIRHPDPSVKDWPVVGEKVFNAWSEASTNLPGYIKENKAGLQNVVKQGIAVSASTMSGIFMFLGAIIIAGIMMAYGQSGGAAMERIFSRFSGREKGPGLLKLSTLTVRSVAAGVLGVAFIQALILGVGFIFAGIPAAGVLAIVVLLLGILQLPALLISIPVVAWLWGVGDGSSVHNLIWTVYLLVGGFADNVLKPLLLGRGVDAPMPVILLGAIGGMISAGIIGLFVGAVLLAVGYQLFMEWVDVEEGEEAAEG